MITGDAVDRKKLVHLNYCPLFGGKKYIMSFGALKFSIVSFFWSVFFVVKYEATMPFYKSKVV